MFDFARDVGKLWACFPEVAVGDVELKPDVVGSSARWFTHTLGIHNEGAIEFSGIVPNQRIVAQSSPGPVFIFTFEADDGGTKLTVDAEWHLPVPLIGPPVGALVMKRSEKDGEAMLAEIKAQVRAPRPDSPPWPRGTATRPASNPCPCGLTRKG